MIKEGVKNHDQANIDSEQDYDNLIKVLQESKERIQMQNAVTLSKIFELCETFEESLNLFETQVT